MPISPRRVAETIVVVLLVVACASTASRAPLATPPPASALATSPNTTSSPPAVNRAIAAIAAGGRHTCALTGSGGVKCWGANSAGQLGDGTTTDRSVPADVAGLAGNVIAIAAGAQHTCVLTSGDAIKCWGANNAGQLGDGTTTDSSVPVDVAGLASGVSAIAAGGSHTCVVTSEGGVRCWGYNEYGQLGIGSTTDSRVPLEVSGLAGGVSAIAAGAIQTCALTTGGATRCWGYGGSGGLGGGISGSLVPVDITGLENRISAITVAYEQTCALTTGGAVQCWGRNYSGQLGDGTTTERGTPVDVVGLGSNIGAISAGFGGQTCALTNAGRVTCWGTSTSSVPIDIAGLESGVAAIAAGDRHTCALTSIGGVRCWGDNWDGQLGNGRPCSSWSSSSVLVDVNFATPPPNDEPTGTPIGPIEHATGPTDVVLRYDRGPDFAVGDLVGELFQPGPEFTLYGDGTVIFRNEQAELPPAVGPIIRAHPFMIAHLDEEQVQSLLRFAIGESGLGDACIRYETQDTDVVGSDVFTIRAGGLDKRVENLGSAPFGQLADYLRNFDRGGILPSVWVPDRYWGNLLDASVFAFIGDGVTPGLADFGIAPWPWADIAPDDFVGRDEGGWIGSPRRIMSQTEAAVLGLSGNGGVVKRIYLSGPDDTAVYYFSLWPVAPDEPR